MAIWCPHCCYELDPAPVMRCPECGKDLLEGDVRSFWVRRRGALVRTADSYRRGAIGLGIWAIWLGAVAWFERPGLWAVVPTLAWGGLVLLCLWMSARCRRLARAGGPKVHRVRWLQRFAGLAAGFGAFFGVMTLLGLVFHVLFMFVG